MKAELSNDWQLYIQSFMKERGVKSYREFYDLFGIKPRTIQDWALRNRRPDFEIMAALLKTFGKDEKFWEFLQIAEPEELMPNRPTPARKETRGRKSAIVRTQR